MALDGDHDDHYVHEEVSLSGGRLSGLTAGELLTRFELRWAYFSEKLLNLENLFTKVEDIAADYEGFTIENEDIPAESVERVFELDILSGILYSEVKELDSFMDSLQMDIVDARHKLSPDDTLLTCSSETDEKLHDAEESLKQSQDRTSDMKTQLSKFEKILLSWHRTGMETVEEIGKNGHLSPMHAKLKLQTVEQQEHFLQLLEKSLGRELDLEKKLTYLSASEEELLSKLHYVEREEYLMEESMTLMLERLFYAENLTEILFSTAKELAVKLQTVQFNLKCSLQRENEIQMKLEGIMSKLPQELHSLEKLETCGGGVDNSRSFVTVVEKPDDESVTDRSISFRSEGTSLSENLMSRGLQVTEDGNQMHQIRVSVEAKLERQAMLHPEISNMRTLIEDLEKKILESKIRAESAENTCELLTKTNKELNEELDHLKNNGTKKTNILEQKLEESVIQLEHAKATVGAIEERQGMLYSTLGDMGHLIEELKEKVAKAESRTESAESKCSLLTETNLALNEELKYKNARLECLEISLRQANDEKVATAKGIGIKTRVIADLARKLALERERLLLEISALRKHN